MLQWKTIKDRSNFPGGRDYEVHRAALRAQVDMSEFGGTGTTYTSISFSIHTRCGNDCHSECFPYMLLAGCGHRIYLRTIDEGKEIAEKIANKTMEQLVNCTKETERLENIVF